MKKRAFFFAALAVFALTSCSLLPNVSPSRKSRSSKSEETSKTSEIASNHKHSWAEWVVTTAPTCTERGQKMRTCTLCGFSEEKDIQALGHDFENGTIISNTSTCTEDGYYLVKCTRCDAIETRPSKASHDWVNEVYHSPYYEDCVTYSVSECYKCGYLKIEIRAIDGALAEGSRIKSGTPDGFMKLNSTNNSISWRFYIENMPISYPNYVGMLYQRGMMDSFSSNTQRTYANTSASSTTTTDPVEGNFRVEVNGQVVDKSPYMDMTYEEMLAGGEDSSWIGDNYSPIALCPIGQVCIGDGYNEITYTRLGSYNLLISDLVMVVYPSDHEHSIADVWSSNEYEHWHACTTPGCPLDGRIDTSVHIWGERYDEIASTCSTKGSYKQRCSVCAYERTVEVETTDHLWGEWTVLKQASCYMVGLREHECSVCHTVEREQIAQLPHDYGEPVSTIGATENYIGSSIYNCSYCGLAAIRWNALDYDVDKTTARSTNSPDVRSSDGSLRFDSTVNYANGDTSIKGSHIVYNVNIPESASNVGFELLTSARSEGLRVSIFNRESSDVNKGYEYVNGELVMTESRYGLKIDGNTIIVDKDESGQQWNGKNWYKLPVTIEYLPAGVHEIEIYNLGGYRVYMYEFQLTGIPHVDSDHVHNGGDVWSKDENYHWHVCTAEGCPITSGIYNKEAHTFGEAYDEVAATCLTRGSYKQTCTVCGYVKTVEVDTLPHTWSDMIVTTAPTHSTDGYGYKVCTTCNEAWEYFAIPATGHLWVADSEVAAEEGMVGYSVYHCSEDSSKKLEFRAIDGTLSEGSTIKSGTPDGFMKLNKNGDSISYTFNYDGPAVTAKIYQRGAIENFNSNMNRGYFTGSGGSATNTCNFDLLFNSALVDVSATMSMTYEELLSNGVDTGISGYSPLADCLIGEISLASGTNTFTYKRVSSYNLVISDFVIVID